MAIAYCLAHPAAANVLFGASRLAQVTENLGALDLLARHGGAAIRERLAGLWRDRDAVRPDASWGTGRS